MTELDEIVRDFVLESREGLDQYDADLLALEAEPASNELVLQIFRTVHTIKGTCGFLPFPTLESLAHAGEELLNEVRHGRLAVDGTLVQLLLELEDALRALLRSIERSGEEGETGFPDLLARLRDAGSAVPARATTDAVQAAERAVLAPRGAAAATVPEPPGAAAGKVRVDAGLLESMINLVGELVTTGNRLALRADSSDRELQQISQKLRQVTVGLQDSVMAARMQSIDRVWKTLPRQVRDLAAQLGKRVHLETDGAETELDRTVLQAIKDPMTHIVRNAVDHGVEAPEVRRALGKPESARIRLRAYHQDGLVNLEVSDDGVGMDPDQLRELAVERGLLTAEAAARLSEHDAYGLIFRGGFSTSTAVTHISGRGVGMDVVRTNIERIGGHVDVESRAGHGTTVRMKIPLTLAIIPALVVSVCGQRYIVPLTSVRELVQVGDGAGEGLVEHVHGAPVHRLRDALLPLLDLRTELGLPPAATDRRTIVVVRTEGRDLGLVVDAVTGTEDVVVKPLGVHFRGIGVYAGGTTMGDGGVALILDVAVLARRAGLSVTSGGPDRAAPWGDAGAAAAPERNAGQSAGPDIVEAVETADAASAPLRLLMVTLGDGSQAALPLAAVRRLEQLPLVSADRISASVVVHYRGGLLPLVSGIPAVSVDTVLPTARNGPAGVAQAEGGAADDRLLTVVVCHIEEVTVGLVVSAIGDVAEGERLSGGGPARSAAAPVVVGDHVRDLIDPQELLLSVDVRLLAHTTSGGALR